MWVHRLKKVDLLSHWQVRRFVSLSFCSARKVRKQSLLSRCCSQWVKDICIHPKWPNVTNFYKPNLEVVFRARGAPFTAEFGLFNFPKLCPSHRIHMTHSRNTKLKIHIMCPFKFFFIFWHLSLSLVGVTVSVDLHFKPLHPFLQCSCWTSCLTPAEPEPLIQPPTAQRLCRCLTSLCFNTVLTQSVCGHQGLILR